MPTIQEMLEDYRKIRADYVDLDKQLREVNSKNDELKETLQRTAQESFRQISELTEENQKLKDMLEVAVEDFDAIMQNEKCIVCSNCGDYKNNDCDYDDRCIWQHRDEALELIFGKEHEDGRSESEP